MMKALVLDIDGVLVGEKIGFNTPDPHPDVLTRLAAIRAQGFPIILCTAKPHYSIQSIITAANLTNPHISDAGFTGGHVDTNGMRSILDHFHLP